LTPGRRKTGKSPVGGKTWSSKTKGQPAKRTQGSFCRWAEMFECSGQGGMGGKGTWERPQTLGASRKWGKCGGSSLAKPKATERTDRKVQDAPMSKAGNITRTAVAARITRGE